MRSRDLGKWETPPAQPHPILTWSRCLCLGMVRSDTLELLEGLEGSRSHSGCSTGRGREASDSSMYPLKCIWSPSLLKDVPFPASLVAQW